MTDGTNPRPDARLDRVEQMILVVRGQRVMVDADLAALYDVPTRRPNEAVKRNASRFPEDFMLQMTAEELGALRSQIAISKEGRGGRRYLPYVFTEQGVAMLSAVLNGERAIQVNIAIMRALVRLRGMLASHADLTRTLEALERKSAAHDEQVKAIFDAIRALMAPPAKPGRRIGF